MTETVNLTIKIDPELKETIKQLALENQISMSLIINRRMWMRFQTGLQTLHNLLAHRNLIFQRQLFNRFFQLRINFNR